MESNPHGANGVTGDPREQACWDFYVASITANRENGYQAAIDAGYSEDHSRNITMQGWFKERKSKLKRKDMLSKAERNLDKVLDMLYLDENGAVKADLLKIVVDVSKTVASTLGKNEGYSARNELTGKDGEKLETITTINYIVPQQEELDITQ